MGIPEARTGVPRHEVHNVVEVFLTNPAVGYIEIQEEETDSFTVCPASGDPSESSS